MINMTNENFYIFVNRSFHTRAVSVNRFNPRSMLKTFQHCFGGFVIIRTFILKVVLNHCTTVNFDTAQNQKSNISKYERGKSLIQREHPSNDQLLSTRQGLHSIPNNPAKESGGFLDRTISIVCCFNQGYILLMNPLLGMNDREDMSIN